MKKQDWFIILIFSLIALILTSKSLQNDVFYTIKIGEDILKYGVDMVDHYSFVGNLSYTYPHWLYDVFIYFIYSMGGYNAIYISTILLCILLLSLIYYLNLNLSKNRGLSFFITVFISFTLKHFIASRAQMLSYILLLIILYSINKIRETDNKRYYIYIFISSLLITNMHLAMYPFVFILFLPFIVQDLIYIINKKKKLKFINNFNILLEKPELKKMFIGILLVFITGFLTPNFLVPFTYFINTNRGISMKYISEHQPPNIRMQTYLYVVIFLIFILSLTKKFKIKLKDLFLILGLILLALLSHRSYALLIILGTFSFIRILENYKNDKLTQVLDNKLFKRLFLLLIVFFTTFLFYFNLEEEYVDSKVYPIKAVNYIKENLDYKNIRLYNEYNYGSYLLMNDIPVLFDSRADLYLEEFNNGVTVFKDFMVNDLEYEKLHKKYNFSHVIIKKKSSLNYLLEKDLNYLNIYNDDYFNIYERKNYEK